MIPLVYADALNHGDGKQAAAIGTAYLSYFEQMCSWFETLSRDTFSREVPQVLLTHVNRLNADKLPDLRAILRKRGYRFVTLEEALGDDAYHTPDAFVGRNGPSWLHRWRVSKGLPPRLSEEPDPPAKIHEMWKARMPPRPE
jgi:hypothetical protein